MSLGPEPSGPVVPAPRRRVVTVRNMRRIKVGVGIAAVALLAAVIGALLQVGAIGSQVLRPTARGDIGETVSFEADAQRYDLILNRTEADLLGLVERAAGRTVCEITFSDGSTSTVRGSRQAFSTETGLGSSIGSFDAVAGPTSVRCDHNVTTGVVIGGYSIAESHRTLTVVSLVLIVVGVMLGIGASWAIASGMRGKAVMIDTPSPQADTDASRLDLPVHPPTP